MGETDLECAVREFKEETGLVPGKLIENLMPYEEIQSLYKVLKLKYSPEYINLFTNRGVEIAFDSKPEDLEIIKVPHAIFTELEK